MPDAPAPQRLRIADIVAFEKCPIGFGGSTASPEMENHIGGDPAFLQFSQKGVVPEKWKRRQPGQIRRLRRRQTPIDQQEIVAFRGETMTEMRADKPGSPGDG